MGIIAAGFSGVNCVKSLPMSEDFQCLTLLTQPHRPASPPGHPQVVLGLNIKICAVAQQFAAAKAKAARAGGNDSIGLESSEPPGFCPYAVLLVGPFAVGK